MPRKKKTEQSTDNIWGKIITGDASEYLPLFEFAEKLKLKEEYLIGLAKSGRLKAFKIDDYWLSTSAWINDWLEEVKNHLHREIGDEAMAEIASLPLIQKRPAVSKKAKAKPSFYRELNEIKNELSQEINKESAPSIKKSWVQDAGSGGSFTALLSTPIKLALAPKQASHSHYALILALFFILAAGLFIYTAALAGF